MKAGFQVRTLHHAEAILKHDMKEVATDLEQVLLGVSIPIAELVHGGGGEGELTQRMRKALTDRKWEKHVFEIKKIVDGEEKESLSHEIDHVRKLVNGTIALEIEWNNQDLFFDRDLEVFKTLHAYRVISIGAIITRGTTLQEGLRDLVESFALRHKIDSLEKTTRFYTPTARQRKMIANATASKGSFQKGWAHTFVSDKFGEATTHWRKLEERVARGVGNPCPLLLIGIPRVVVH